MELILLLGMWTAGAAIIASVTLLGLLAAWAIGGAQLRRQDSPAPTIKERRQPIVLWRKVKKARPVLKSAQRGDIVRTFTSTGRRIKATVVARTRRGYELVAVGRPYNGAIRRKLVMAA